MAKRSGHRVKREKASKTRLTQLVGLVSAGGRVDAGSLWTMERSHSVLLLAQWRAGGPIIPVVLVLRPAGRVVIRTVPRKLYLSRFSGLEAFLLSLDETLGQARVEMLDDAASVTMVCPRALPEAVDLALGTVIGLAGAIFEFLDYLAVSPALLGDPAAARSVLWRFAEEPGSGVEGALARSSRMGGG